MKRLLSELKIELTQRCPLACVHCSTNSTRKQQSSLPEPVTLRLLREAAALGAKKVVFTGGEPLLSPYLHVAIGTASSLSIAPTLYTSGIVDNALTPMGVGLAGELTANGLARFIFSVYSHRPAVHESITRYGTHSATLSAVRNAVSTGIPVELHFVAMQRNYRDLAGLVDLAASVGAAKVSVLRFVPQGRGRNVELAENLGPDELRELADSITHLRARHSGITIRAGSPFNILGIGHTPCNAAQDVLIVNHRGDIFPCDAFKNVRYADGVFGNVLEHSLSDVWDHSKFLNEVRATLDEAKGETCNSCEQAASCQSGCLAQKVIRLGWQAARESDPDCLIQPTIEDRPALVQIAPLTA